VPSGNTHAKWVTGGALLKCIQGRPDSLSLANPYCCLEFDFIADYYTVACADGLFK
jgi:hypothetical protein